MILNKKEIYAFNDFFEKHPQTIYEYNDSDIGLHSYIVIDSLINGNSCGGIRISNDLTLEEIKVLARMMTLKYSFLKTNTGGAKAGIRLPVGCTPEQRIKILEAFGKKASDILRSKTYVPWIDLNSEPDDIGIIMKSAGCDFKGISDSSYFTALTVISAMKAVYETKNIDISKNTVIIEGFGKVGAYIAYELKKYNVKIIGISTISGMLYDNNGLDIDKLLELRNKYKDDLVKYYPADFIGKTEPLLEIESDILIPCARTFCINSKNMDKIRTKIIVPGANAPLTREAEIYLNKKGVICFPDFICNLGGIFGTYLYDNKLPTKTIYNFIMKKYSILIKEIILRSIKDNCLPSHVAEAIARENYNKINYDKQKESLNSKHLKRFLQKVMQAPNLIPMLNPYFTLLNQKIILDDNIKNIKKIII